jgi:hypothetical protein
MPDELRAPLSGDGQYALIVRLASRNGVPCETGVSARAYALIGDLVRSRLLTESVTGDDEFVYTTGIGNLGAALATTRMLQFAWEGFLRENNGVPCRLTVLVDSARPGAPSAEQKRVCELAKPAQVLLTQAICERFARAAPSSFEAIPDLPGMYEFLWTTREQLNTLQVLPQATAPVEPLTGIFDQKKNPSLNPAGWEAPPKAKVPDPGVDPIEKDETSSASGRWKLPLAGLAAAVLLAVCGFGIWYGSRGNAKPQPPKPDGRTSTVVDYPPADLGGQQKTAPQPSSSSAPNGPPPRPSGEIPSNPTAPTKPNPRNEWKTSPRTAPPVQDETKRPKANQGVCEGTPVADLLRYAKQKFDNGDNENARREYQQVLNCEPGNAEARTGIARAEERLKER